MSVFLRLGDSGAFDFPERLGSSGDGGRVASILGGSDSATVVFLGKSREF